MADTYSSRPFISYDGPDDTGHRAEVKVVTGFGIVSAIDPSEKGKSAKVSFTVENTKYKPAGWAPVGSAVHQIVEKARESGDPIYFRLETRRKDSVDRKIPISELSSDATVARDNIYKSLAAVKNEFDTEWTISQHAKTNMAEDPSSSTGGSANDYTIEELQAMSGKNKAGNSNSKRFEGLPFDLYNPDGSLNPGSVAVSVPLNLYAFLTEYIKENGLDVSDKDKFLVVRSMLKVCNNLQLAIYDGKLEKPDLTAGSHTRARALVFESTRAFYPLTVEIMTDAERLEEWMNDTVTKTTAMWKWSMKEVQSLLK
jgi:DNA-binding phage protein